MARSRARALIAGDGSAACVSLQANLQILGLIVDVVDGCLPIDILQKCQAASGYTLLFVGVDWVLAGGHDFASEMRNRRQSCSSPAVIGIVPRDQPAIAKRCLDMGMADVIAAPFYLDALYESICSTSNGRDTAFFKETESEPKLDHCVDNLVDMHDGLTLLQDIASKHEHPEPIFAAKQDPALQQVDSSSSAWPLSVSISSCIAQKTTRNASLDIFRQPTLTSEEVVLPDTWALPANRNHCIA